MLTTIVGYIWIAAGLLFLLKPAWLKRSFTKKGVKNVKRLILITAVTAGVLLIGAAWDTGGVLGTVLLAAGVIAILKGFFFMRTAFTERVIAFLEPRPLSLFRVAAVVYIIFGVFLVSGLGREAKEANAAVGVIAETVSTF